MCIFLIGFMGSGKSYWAKKWAEKYHLKFIDMDDLIENQTGKSIQQIFDEEGENGFRLREKRTLQGLPTDESVIVACGGGTACYFDNLQWMNEIGITLYLKASVEQIISRVSTELYNRPLVKNIKKDELKPFIENKLQQREPYYSQAKFTIAVEDLDENSIRKFINP
ncbi:MAG: shikimate kinase [Ferruginibacter sp.]